MDTCTRVDVDVAVQDETLPCAVAGNHIACRFFGRWHTSDVRNPAGRRRLKWLEGELSDVSRT